MFDIAQNICLVQGVLSNTLVEFGQRYAPVGSQESRRIAAPLAHRVGDDADAAQIADAVVATWQEIDAALVPIIGQRGVAALYRRSLYLTSSVHSWMVGMHEGTQLMDLASLSSALARQSATDAAASGGALLQTFYELLSTLVGPSLAERLLRPVWVDSLDGSPAHDTSP